MKLVTTLQDRDVEFDVQRGIDVSIPIQRSESVSSFMIKGAVYEDYQDGDFIGNKNRGGSCNLETITFTAHGNGSHTECVGHIAYETFYVNDCINDDFKVAQVVSLGTRSFGDGLAVNFDHFEHFHGCSALLIRTLPNADNKIHRDYSGQPTPCIAPEDMRKLVALGIEHLLVDLPSVDPEWDGGKLTSHHIFWNYPEAPRKHCSITEFIYLPDEVSDGRYLLKLNLSNFISDAAPSKPTLYPEL